MVGEASGRRQPRNASGWWAAARPVPPSCVSGGGHQLRSEPVCPCDGHGSREGGPARIARGPCASGLGAGGLALISQSRLLPHIPIALGGASRSPDSAAARAGFKWARAELVTRPAHCHGLRGFSTCDSSRRRPASSPEWRGAPLAARARPRLSPRCTPRTCRSPPRPRCAGSPKAR